MSGTVDYLTQQIPSGPGATVSDLLGIAETRTALRVIVEGARPTRSNNEQVGDGWDVDKRAAAEPASLGLPEDLDRPVWSLSGGEAMLTGITCIRIHRADLALLDEPMNYLDGHSERLTCWCAPSAAADCREPRPSAGGSEQDSRASRGQFEGRRVDRE